MSAVGLGVVYATRGVWRPYVAEIQRPAIPVATSYRPIPSPPTSTRAVTSTPSIPVAPIVPPARPVDPFLFEGTRPAEANLAVPFMLQAPKQNWDMPYQEACEEASLLMVQNFLNGRTVDFTADEADRLILDLVSYETSQGDAPDVTLRRIGEIAAARYGVRPVVKELVTMEAVRNAIANGYPVILPASGKALKNPNFRNGGPLYHMLVIKGYLRDGRMIVNDPGTRKGKDYIYDANILLNAAHDWNDGNVLEGEKIVLVLLPKK